MYQINNTIKTTKYGYWWLYERHTWRLLKFGELKHKSATVGTSEIEEKCCEIAANRCSQGVMRLET